MELEPLYRELDALLEARGRDFPRRVEPTWSRLVERLETLGAALREEARLADVSPEPRIAEWIDRLVGSPVFVVGCQRSGTTLLRRLLDGHPEVAVALPVESRHFTKTLREGSVWIA